MPLALLSEILQMPQLIPQHLKATIYDTILQVATRTPHAPRIPTTTLLVVEIVDGGTTQLPCFMVALASPWLLLLVLNEHFLSNGLTWIW